MKKTIIFFLTIVLMLIVTGCKSKRVEINTFEDLAKEGVRISIGNPEHVPAGMYTLKLLENLSKESPSLAEKIMNNVVSKEVHVIAVLEKVLSGEVDAGFVYRTDFLSKKEKLEVIEIPENVRVRAIYAIALLSDGNKKKGEKFLEFLNSKEGRAILSKYGFHNPKSGEGDFVSTPLFGEIIVYAAASLTKAFKEIGARFEELTGCKVVLNFGSSGALEQKIESGARADVFASANIKMVEILKEKEFIEGYTIFAENELVVVKNQKNEKS